MPVPYMGSKRKSASKIVNIIEAYCPNNNKKVYDLFTGGFAIGEEFLKKGYEVIANDKNKYVIALLEEVINKGLNESKCTEWISREKFKDILDNPSNYEDWYVGYVMCIWSFGNKQKDYLFGKQIEKQKESLFELVVNKRVDDFITSLFPIKYINGIIQQENWHKRRMTLMKVISVLGKRNGLESLESLERLQRLESLGGVKFLNKSYNEIEIEKEFIVYCDPPYRGTAEYKEGGFNHDIFWQWVREKSKTNKVFVSEYTAPEDFTCIYEFSQGSSLGGGGTNTNQPNEKLFVLK